MYSAFAVCGTSGLGAVFPEVQKMYPGQETRATDLLTYPTLFMGIGNLISMPLSVSIGRRPVFLISLVILVASGIWCALAQGLGSHIAGRDIFSLAAGQSEALAPMIIQEIHFLHERGERLAWFIVVQTVGTAGMFIATTYLVPAWGIRWWYGIITIVNGVVLILSFFFIVETKFDRVSDAHGKSSPNVFETSRPVAIMLTTRQTARFISISTRKAMSSVRVAKRKSSA